MNSIIKKNYMTIICLALIIIGEIVFFRNILFTSALIGDGTDGILNTLFAEHWYQVLRGQEKWSELTCFYPAENVLSYSDMMLGVGIPYSFFRLLGFSKYIAVEIVYVLIHVVGSIAMYYFCFKCINLKELVSLIVVWLFSFSTSYYALTTNPQMFTVSFIPILLIMIHKYYKNIQTKKRWVYGCLAVIFFEILFYTAFYVGFFMSLVFMFSLLSYFIVALVVYLRKKERVIDKELVAHWKDYIVLLLLAIVLIGPFVYLYIPTVQQIGGREWETVLQLIPTLKDVFNISDYTTTGYDSKYYNCQIGINIILFVLLVGLVIYSFVFNKNNKNKKNQLWLLILFITCFLISIKIGNFSLWYIIWKIIPGASAIRAQARFIFMTVMILAFLVGVLINEINIKRRYLQNIIYVAVFVVVVVLNQSNIGNTSNWTYEEIQKIEDNTSQPPKDCKAFFVTVDKETIDLYDSRIEIYAWVIAEKYGLKTLNGYSGQKPIGWDFDVYADNYIEKVNEWINLNKLDNIYKYSFRTNSWEKYN